jgi:hypothetical protein
MIMSYTLLRLVSALCELLGVFFLSVEAIKLKNFRLLQYRIIKPFYSIINPKITFFDESADESKRKVSGIMARFFHDPIIQFFAILTCFGGVVIILIIQTVTQLRAILFGTTTQLTLTFVAELVLPFVIASWAVGILVYTVFVGLVLLIMRFFDCVDRYAPTGSIGILGFLLFLISWSISTYIGLLSPT